MPDWDTGYLDFEVDERRQMSTSMDPANLGQMYYGLGGGTESDTSIFWWDLLQEYLPQNDLNFSDWMANFGG